MIDGTSAANTICYPPKEHEKSCPITEIRVILNEERSQYEERNFTVKVFNDTALIAYSRSEPNLPITTIKVEHEPCMDPFYQSSGPW